MDLLIIPIVLAIGGILFTRSENRATQAAAERRAQEDALQAYLDNMAEMLIPNNDQPTLYDEPPPDSLRAVARARTLTVLPRLAGNGKGRVVQFLRESNLIPRVEQDEQGEVVQEKVVYLSGADLSYASLYRLDLRRVALDGVSLERADLSYADLPDADFGGTRLSGADLTGADLSRASLLKAKLLSEQGLKAANLSFAVLAFANLQLADLSGTNLWGTSLVSADLWSANLSGAYLLGTDLSGAYLFAAKLSGAHLDGANLTGATGWTEVQLNQAKTLKGATMPDGQVLKGPASPHGPTFTEWRKSREEQG
jgi:uncharacterized protein YjbI with pentapeptide repeats